MVHIKSIFADPPPPVSLSYIVLYRIQDYSFLFDLKVTDCLLLAYHQVVVWRVACRH